MKNKKKFKKGFAVFGFRHLSLREIRKAAKKAAEALEKI